MTESTTTGRKGRGPGDAQAKRARQTRRLVEMPETPIVAPSPPFAAPSRTAPEVGPAVGAGAKPGRAKTPRA